MHVTSLDIQQRNAGTNYGHHTKRRKHHHTKIWKKKEVQLERCGTTQYTDITDSKGPESEKLQCPKSHTQVS